MKEYIPQCDTSEFARNEENTFYPVDIAVSHWQLRHYLSGPEADHLYYASGRDVYCLNTVSHKRKHIAKLPFDARCTASGYGWMCVGGEPGGHFAAIKLEGDGPRTAALDVDAPLPLEYVADRGDGRRRATSVKIERIGREIVNSISIHRVQDEAAHLDDIVAVLTNNDKTVRVYSLPQSLETTVLELPFPMNHATMSPDGAMLVAVGDLNEAYFFSREIKDTPPQIPKPHNRLTSASVKWTLTNVVSLHGSEAATSFGYFTTAWSPSGRLVALGSEGGYITIVEMDILCDDDYSDDEAIVAVIPSSRPDLSAPYSGAVRSMLFSPAPWDLLIWAEDLGRVCIGDLRSGLRRKQVIRLDVKDENLRRAQYHDLPSDVSPEIPSARSSAVPRNVDAMEADMIRNHRRGGTSRDAEANFATEYIEARALQQQQRNGTVTRSGLRAAVEDDPQGLTAREQQDLESLRTTRQREEARAQGQTPRSINYTTPDMFVSHTRTSGTTNVTNEPSSARPTNDALAAAVDTFPERSRTQAQLPRPSSARDESDGLAAPALLPFHAIHVSGARSSDNSVSRLPRRRASIILAAPGQNAGASTTAAAASTRRPTPTTAVSATLGTDDENPWRTISEHLTLTRGPLFEHAERAQASSTTQRPTDTELQVELVATQFQRQRLLARQRERLHNSGAGVGAAILEGRRIRANFPDGYGAPLLRTQLLPLDGRDVRTAGLAMSPDGGMLWVACEEGIFQIPIDVKSRFFWPSVELR